MKDQIKIFLKELKVPSELIEYGADELHELLSIPQPEPEGAEKWLINKGYKRKKVSSIHPKENDHSDDIQHDIVVVLLNEYASHKLSTFKQMIKEKRDQYEAQNAKHFNKHGQVDTKLSIGISILSHLLTELK